MTVPAEHTGTADEGSTFAIGRRGTAWRVISGELDVFVARGGPAGGARWRPLLSLGPGALLPAVPHGRWGHEAFGRSSPGAVIEPVAISDIKPGDAGAVDAALAELLASLHDELPPREFSALSPSEVQRAPAGTVLRAVVPVAWLDVLEGEARLRGRVGSRAVGAGETLAVGEGDWITAETAVAVRVRATETLIAAGELAEALDELSAEAVRIVEQRLARAEEAELGRAGEREGRDEALRATTFDAFGALLRRGEDLEAPVAGTRDPLFAAARLVAAAQGIELAVPPAHVRDEAGAGPLGAIARASRVHVRTVTLPRRWWTQDVGPLLARRGEEGHPVALLPRGGGYRLHDPATGERRRVSAALAAELEPTAVAFASTLPARSLRLRELAGFALRGLRLDLLTFLGAAVAVAALGLLTPVVTGSILGTLVPAGETGLVAALCLVLAGAAVVAALIGAIQNLTALRVQGRAGAALQGAVWSRVMALPATFHRGRSTGDLATSALAPTVIQEILGPVILGAALALIVGLANLVLIAVYEVALAVLAVVVVAGAGAVTTLAARRQLQLQRRAFAQTKTLNSRAFQLIDRAGKLRSAAAEERGFAYWADAFLAARRTLYLARGAQNRFAAFAAALTLVAMAAAFVVAGSLLEVEPGTFLAFNVAFGSVLASTVLLSTTVVSATSVVPLFEAVRPIVEAEPEVAALRSDPGELSGAIEVNGASFRYRSDGPLVLDDVSLRAEAGEFVAIVGPSGCGKSTLLRLLLGFEQPQTGAVLYDGLDLADLDATSVRRQCGVVLQDGKLLAGDLFGNVAGTGLFTENDVWAALEMSGLAEDVRAMPMGLSTMTAASGGTLSGGQQQRLMIARALVSRPRILFLDEATSALDNRTQETVAESTRRLAATRIVIAHRLSTIRGADRIVVMDAGRVVQQGTYDELLAADGLFRTLAERQLG